MPSYHWKQQAVGAKKQKIIFDIQLDLTGSETTDADINTSAKRAKEE